MNFTLRLKKETAEKHKKLDTHPFITKFYNNTQDSYTTKINLKYYIELHFILLNEIYKTIQKRENYPNFVDKFNKGKNYNTTIQLKNLNSVKNLINHISDDNIIEYCYAFYLGILYGGQMIKKLINKTEDEILIEQSNMLFDFECDKKELINEIKTYLDDNTVDQDLFIKNVNTIYELMKHIFTDFDFKKC